MPAPTGEVPVIGPARLRRRRRPHHYLLMITGWPLLLAILVVVVLRWRDVDEVYLVALVALTPFLLAPLAVADVIAWFSRSRTLQVAAAAVSAVCLFTVAPFDAVVGCRPSGGDDAVTVMTANVLSGGGQANAIAANIVAVDPDVVLFQEANGRFIEALASESVLDGWPHRSNDGVDARRGVAVWSKWPLSDIDHGVLDANASVRAAVDTPQGRFTVASLHVASPISGEEIEQWHQQLTGLGELPTDRPMVIGGDFNATEDHRPFRRLLERGWTDVHDDKGCGPDLTWPTRGLPLPVMRLDHILITDDFEVLSTEIGDAGGSDHYPVISRIRFTER